MNVRSPRRRVLVLAAAILFTASDLKHASAQHSNELFQLFNLALSYSSQGRCGEAEEAYKRVVAMSETRVDEVPAGLKGSALVQLYEVLFQLGELYMRQERYGEAETLIRRSIVIGIRAHEVASLHVGYLHYGLAEVLRSQGRYADAELSYRHSLEATRGGINYSLNIHSYRKLAEIAASQQRFGEAEAHLARAVELVEWLRFGNNSGISADQLMQELAAFYETQHRTSEAEALRQRASRVPPSLKFKSRPVPVPCTR